VELQSIVTRSSCPSRQLRRTAEMGGFRTFAEARSSDRVAPKADLAAAIPQVLGLTLSQTDGLI
jgi:hypothetical protein